MAMHSQILISYSDPEVSQEESRTLSAAADDISDVYPIQLRLTVMREANNLAIRVCKKLS